MQQFVSLFPVWAIALSTLSYFYPALFASGKNAIIPLLALVMLGMGMTITWQNFKQAVAQPKIISIAVAIQFLLMPFFGYWIARFLQLPSEQIIGLVLVGSSAGGTASNVICYLARGNVALSILMTLSSTLCAVLLMPVLTWLYLNQMVQVPVLDMISSICLIVLIPVISGTVLNSLLTKQLRMIQPVFPVISCLAIIFIIAIIVGLNHSNLSDPSIPLISAVILHNLLGICAGYSIPRFLKYDKKTCRTVCIEVGMQNSGLSVALAIKYFSTLAALPGAIFSIWHNISGALLAAYWRSTDSH